MGRTVYRYKILYEKGVIPQIAKRFNVSEQTVRAAFRFATASEQSDLIRETAIKEYGCVLTRRPMTMKLSSNK